MKENNLGIISKVKPIETQGDKETKNNKKSKKRGRFIKALKNPLRKRKVHFLVHSLKDTETKLPKGMAKGSIYKRKEAGDCVIFHSKHRVKRLQDLPKGSKIGTGSARRVAQLMKLFPHLEFDEKFCGNLNTRLKKWEERYDAIILAKAGVERMGWTKKIG